MKGKLDALSDAIIAIAITVLVLEINTPTSMEDMWQFAREIFLFAQSFVVIANFWFERSQFFGRSKRISFSILSIDLLAHLGICLIPLFTKFLFSFENRVVSLLAYGILIAIISVLFDIENYFVLKQSLEEANYERTDEMLKVFKRFHIRSYLTSVIILGLSFVRPQIVIYFYLLIPITKFLSRFKVGKNRYIFVDEDLVVFSDKVLSRFDDGRLKRGQKE
ncbi:TMEM175 family protein [uncultured Granulicatella sp.]|uniref:TMEM175 family protein n=1 Tax=uncultured Granulicatella sp. TaxID=316089 RepID=UPI002633BD91|nr:TMEM175 family protein [uncultured Granulicatella sp.]